MNLTTDYLGLKLRNPLIVGASPFADNGSVAQQLQDAGAAAIVMRSLFEEQIDAEQRALTYHLETPAESNSEATSFFPAYDEYQLAPELYLKQIERLKKQLSIPVIASLGSKPPSRSARSRSSPRWAKPLAARSSTSTPTGRRTTWS